MARKKQQLSAQPKKLPDIHQSSAAQATELLEHTEEFIECGRYTHVELIKRTEQLSVREIP
jgi:hypothetical protein